MRVKSINPFGRIAVRLCVVMYVGFLVFMTMGCGDSGGGSKYTPPTPLSPLSWPRFHGPDGLGLSATGTALTSWDESTSTGIKWKSSVPLRGASSPVVCGNKVFLTGADATKREVYCYDADTGDLLWQRQVATGSSPTQTTYFDHTVNITFAANTVAMDGTNVYAIFGNGDVACFDHNGVQRWVRSLGLPYESAWGYSSSLILYGDFLIVQMDQDDDGSNHSQSRLIALNKSTGTTAWEKSGDQYPVKAAYSTPLIINAAGSDQLITCNAHLDGPEVFSHDPNTGDENWSCEVLGTGADIATSPIYVTGILIVLGNTCLAGIDPSGTGVVTPVWTEFVSFSPEGPTPAVTGNILYLVDVYGGSTGCFDLSSSTPTELWTHTYSGVETNPSPIIVGGNVYVLHKNGTTEIMRDNGGAYQSIGTGVLLDDSCSASPAYANGYIYIRSKDYLYCIGN